MNNFLTKIHAPIVRIEGMHYAYIANLFGIAKGYDKGIYLFLNDVLLEYENLEELLSHIDNSGNMGEFMKALKNVEEDIFVAIPKNIMRTSVFETIDHYETIESTDYVYYANLNRVLESTSLTEDAILNAKSTFANIILTQSNIEDVSIKTQIYKKVLSFYRDNMTDETLQTLNLIMSSSSYSYNDMSTMTSCGCNSSSSNPTLTQSCPESYVAALSLYMKQMFSDLDFYYTFMFVDNEPNEILLNNLIELLKALLNMNLSMNFDKKDTNHCKCGTIENNNESAIKAILNYIKVLEWIKNCEIEENTNKIRLYGENFAEIFPNLSF